MLNNQFYCSSRVGVKAVERDDIESLRFFLANSVMENLDAQDIRKMWDAAFNHPHCNLAMFKLLAQSFPKRDTVADDLIYTNICLSAASKGKVDVLEWVHEINACNAGVYRPAINFGHINVIKWAQGKNIDFVAGDTTYQVTHDDIEVLEWAKEKGAIFAELCVEAAIRGHVIVLQWAKDNQYSCTDSDIFFNAHIYGQTDVVSWATAHRVDKKLSAEQCESVMKNAALGLGILKWYFENGIDCNPETLRTAFIYGNLEILQWASSLGNDYIPTPETLTEAAKQGSLNSVEWAHEKNHRIDQNTLPYVASEGCFDIVKWAVEKLQISDSKIAEGILHGSVTSKSCRIKQATSAKEIIEWAVKKGALLTSKTIWDAFYHRLSAGTLKWLIENGPPANEHCFSTCVWR
eukprot:Partr_v1_DN28759_c0_g1_i4_m63281 putative Ankyrin Repeat Protein